MALLFSPPVLANVHISLFCLDSRSVISTPASCQPSRYCQCGQRVPVSSNLLPWTEYRSLSCQPPIRYLTQPVTAASGQASSSSLHRSRSGRYHLIPHLTPCSKRSPSQPYLPLLHTVPPTAAGLWKCYSRNLHAVTSLLKDPSLPPGISYCWVLELLS